MDKILKYLLFTLICHILEKKYKAWMPWYNHIKKKKKKTSIVAISGRTNEMQLRIYLISSLHDASLRTAIKYVFCFERIIKCVNICVVT